jgi:hypothetical protein
MLQKFVTLSEDSSASIFTAEGTLFYPEDGSSIFLLNAGIFLQGCVMSDLRRFLFLMLYCKCGKGMHRNLYVT